MAIGATGVRAVGLEPTSGLRPPDPKSGAYANSATPAANGEVPSICAGTCRGSRGIRTHNLLIKSQLLCQVELATRMQVSQCRGHIRNRLDWCRHLVPCTSMPRASARAVAQFGSAPALGAGGRRFKSGQPDREPGCTILCGRCRGCSSMVELQPSKLAMRVRFPSPALRTVE